MRGTEKIRQSERDRAVSYTHLDVYKRQVYISILCIFDVECFEKHDTIFKAVNIENTKKTNIYTTITHRCV